MMTQRARPVPGAFSDQQSAFSFEDGKWQATHISMNGVAGVLSRQLRGPVIDQTGIKGTFDINVQWANDVTSDRPDDPLPSMATVLRETLGLEVKSGRGPVRVFVIDHIERSDR